MEKERWLMGIVLLVVGFGLGYLAFATPGAWQARDINMMTGGTSSGGVEGVGMMWPGKMLWRNDREELGMGLDFNPEKMRGWCLSQFASSTPAEVPAE